MPNVRLGLSNHAQFAHVCLTSGERGGLSASLTPPKHIQLADGRPIIRTCFYSVGGCGGKQVLGRSNSSCKHLFKSKHTSHSVSLGSETQLYDSSAETLTSRKLYGMFRIIAIAAVQFLCFLTPSRAIIERHPWTTKGMMLARLRLDLIHRSPRSTQLTLIFHKANMVGHRTQRLKVVWRSSMSGLRCKSLQATRQVSWTPHYSQSQQQIIHSF